MSRKIFTTALLFKNVCYILKNVIFLITGSSHGNKQKIFAL